MYNIFNLYLKYASGPLSYASGMCISLHRKFALELREKMRENEKFYCCLTALNNFSIINEK